MKVVNVYFLSIFAFLFLISASGLAQGPSAAITVEALSPQEIHDMGWTSHPSTGLKTVGQGDLVYLSGKEAGDEEVTSYAWSIQSMPAGAAATLDSTDKAWTTFAPDTTGQYVIKLAITTATGAAEASVTITSAHYVGVGIVGGLTPDFAKGQCALCHAANTADWSETGHATMFELAIDGLKSSHYNEGCVECHTVGFNESPEAVNGGFDDVARNLGWAFPDTLQPGNWANIVANFKPLAHVSNIQCENCHGPGSQHFGDPAKIDITLDAGVCGRCHEEEPYHVKNVQWKNSGHGSGETWEGEGLREIEPTDDFRTECAYCHSPTGFVERVDPASKALDRIGLTGEPLGCAACHDPHDATNEYQLRLPLGVQLASGPMIEFGGLGRLCMRCHQDRRVGGGEAYAKNPTRTYRGPHHSNQTDMLAGAKEAVITFGMVLPNSTHKDVIENSCVDCHMAETGRDDLGEHSWAMNTTEIVNGDTLTHDNVTACVECHGPMTSFEDIKAREDYDGDGTIEAATAEVEGLLDEVAKLLPPYGEPTVDIRDPLWNMEGSLLQRQAAWNWAFVDYDHSHGVHNYQFAVALLKISRAALMYGVLSPGVITGISDVPNDQGKQARVTWTRFGGDGVSNNPVTRYAIWRRVDDAMSMAKAAGSNAGVQKTIIKSFENLPTDPAKLTSGAILALGTQLWDYVGSVPSAAQDVYSTVVPTLFDSTKAGIKWSVFMVSGLTAIPAVYAVTAPDSGYSIDNLAPAAPGNVLLAESVTGIDLAWDDPVDDDFNYFAVYRSTSANFDPSAMQPIATVTEPKYVDADVVAGTTYFYRLSAFDFAGNRSVFSPEKSLLVTGVISNINTVPDDFALEQNYPNPFNPSTMIQFGLPRADRVRIEIFDIRGALVKTLVDDKLSAGYHAAVWNGLNDTGYSVSAGTYLYRMVSGAGTITKKMVYMK